jgi:2-phospho-L-lactate/phosphoenolpyruvate guanylyltransferase
MARVTVPDHAQVVPATSWGVVVPVKRLALAKSRLRLLGDAGRQALALAFAEDVALTALACPAVRRVLVVTDDPRVRRAMRELGAETCPDRPDAGLNAALGFGADELHRDEPGLGVVAVSADLPALRAADLGAVLRATRTRAAVPDAGGTGTTVLAAAPGHRLDPRFGEGSLARHLESGAELLAGPARVRRDVDTPEDLRDAVRLGVGPRTSAVLADLGPPEPGWTGLIRSAQGTMLP